MAGVHLRVQQHVLCGERPYVRRLLHQRPGSHRRCVGRKVHDAERPDNLQGDGLHPRRLHGPLVGSEGRHPLPVLPLPQRGDTSDGGPCLHRELCLAIVGPASRGMDLQVGDGSSADGLSEQRGRRGFGLDAAQWRCGHDARRRRQDHLADVLDHRVSVAEKSRRPLGHGDPCPTVERRELVRLHHHPGRCIGVWQPTDP